MGQVAWVEILSRHHDVAARYRLDLPEISIGRAYGNDVVLDDPYVAAHHLRLRREGEGWIAEDLGSTNGLYVDHASERVTSVVMHGDTILRIGHTYLRIRETHHPVAAERALKHLRRGWPVTLSLAAAVLLVVSLLLWIEDVSEPRIITYLMPLCSLALGLLAWATVWALLCRVFSGRAYFEHNLFIALCGFAFFIVYDEGTDYLDYSLAWDGLKQYQYISLWILLAAICIFHLREIGRTHMRLKAGVTLSLALLAIGMQVLEKREMENNGFSPPPATVLKPPAFRLARVQDEARYFGHVTELQKKLLEDRAKAPEGASDNDD